MDEKILTEELAKINIELTKLQQTQLQIYFEMINTWSKKFNLTSLISKEDVYLKHFYDSLTASKVCDFTKKINCCDMGTGAGLPGIVLKIIFSEMEITLIESSNKKCLFLQNVVNSLNLKNVTIINERVEDYARKNREIFDVVITRALAPLSTILEFGIPLLKIEGQLIALKGHINEELDNCKNAFQILSCSIEKKEEFLLPLENSFRTILAITKTKSTNPKYPRDFEKMKKKPL